MTKKNNMAVRVNSKSSSLSQGISEAWKKIFTAEKNSNKNNLSLLENDNSASIVASLWLEVEESLLKATNEGGGLNSFLSILKSHLQVGDIYLTAVLPGDVKNYYIIASSSELPLNLELKIPLSSGLAGWVHNKAKALAKPQFKADGQVSYIFYKDEPLKNITSFYGWPLIFNQQLRGAMFILGSGKEEELSEVSQTILEAARLRLLARLQQDRLVNRVLEQTRLDPQTGLPHRVYFLERLRRLIEVSEMSDNGVCLYVLGVVGLGAFSIKNGQEAASQLIRSISQELLNVSRSSWEIGHISYGVFTVAARSSEADSLKKILNAFARKLEDWPLPHKSGRAGLKMYPVMASFPENAHSSEELLEVALAFLVSPNNEN